MGLPFVYFAYFKLSKNGEYDYLYRAFNLGIVLLIPTLIFLHYSGYKIIGATWDKITSPIQYYLFYLTSHTTLKGKLTESYKVTQTLCACAAAGYLYEVPKWLNQGLIYIIRTSRHSPVILEWGMLSVIILYGYMVDVSLNKWVLLSLTLYMFYCFIYIYDVTLFANITNHTPNMRILYYRIPAMLLVYTTSRHKLNIGSGEC